MSHRKRDAQKLATRAKILAVAKSRFERLGYELTTIRDIAIAAEMSTGAVFSNWRSKEELYRQIFGHPPITPEQGKRLHDALVSVGIEPSRLLAA